MATQNEDNKLMKTCSKCAQTKTVEEYHLAAYGYFQSACKCCMVETEKQRRARVKALKPLMPKGIDTVPRDVLVKLADAWDFHGSDVTKTFKKFIDHAGVDGKWYNKLLALRREGVLQTTIQDIRSKMDPRHRQRKRDYFLRGILGPSAAEREVLATELALELALP